MLGDSLIELSVPGQLHFCDVARRVIMESCKLVAANQELLSNSSPAPAVPAGLPSDRYEFNDQFTLEFISAFSEIFNNVALHAYKGHSGGAIDFKIHLGDNRLTVDIRDDGAPFDIQAVPLPDELPTGGMGIFIARSMLDELEYQPGPPNRWRLIKYVSSAPAEISAEGTVAHE